MAGIVSYGAYVPFNRLSRAEIAASWGTPKMPGEKAVANYDEDSLTMAVAAVRDCIKGIGIEGIDGLYFASTTPPYKEKQTAATIAAVLGMSNEAVTMDFSGSLRAGTNAVRAAMDAVNSGSAKSVLVCASDVRLGHPMGSSEMVFGDGAGALLIGNENVIAEIEASHTVNNELLDVWRSDQDLFVRSGEDRFIMQEGYSRIIREAVTGALNRFDLKTDDFIRLALNAPNARQLTGIAKTLGFDPKTQIQNQLSMEVGDTGTAMSIMSLVAALEESKSGERILLASYGNGCDVLSVKVTGDTGGSGEKRGMKGHMDEKQMIPRYSKYLRWRELLDVQPPPRPPKELRQPTPAAQWRENEKELRLNGSKCNNCGAPQYPVQRICMNCSAKDDFEYYSFADKKAQVSSFSHDYVMETPDPPVTLTVVNFEGGGRIICDMTDRDPDEVKVGMPVEMTFRRLYYVGGIYNYWWKCKPKRTA